MSDIFVYATEGFQGIWLQCDKCKTSTGAKHAKHGVKIDRLIEWVKNHKCSGF